MVEARRTAGGCLRTCWVRWKRAVYGFVGGAGGVVAVVGVATEVQE
jgi:hypothetical protein